MMTMEEAEAEIRAFAERRNVNAGELLERASEGWVSAKFYLDDCGATFRLKGDDNDGDELHALTEAVHWLRWLPAAAPQPPAVREPAAAPAAPGATSLTTEQMQGLLAAAQRDAARAAPASAPRHVVSHGTPTEALVAFTPDPPGFNPYARDRAADARATWGRVLDKLSGAKP
jgi:hypothetical protein